jgi:hypothetical protein
VAGHQSAAGKRSQAVSGITGELATPTFSLEAQLHCFPERPGEDERQRIVKRANDGRVAARRRGVHMGRKPKLSELQRRVARERVAKHWSAARLILGRRFESSLLRR